MKETARAIRAISRRLRQPKFRLLDGWRNPPAIGAQCEFKSPGRIAVGKGVEFLTGAVVCADEQGSIEIGAHSSICRYAIIQSIGGRIKIGHTVMIGDFCNIYGQGGLTIGNYVLISAGCRIVPNQHTFDSLDRPISRQPCKAQGIAIADDVWIGANVVILDGVTIGQGVVVGAGSVVTRSIPPYSLAVGNPARVIRSRSASRE